MATVPSTVAVYVVPGSSRLLGGVSVAVTPETELVVFWTVTAPVESQKPVDGVASAVASSIVVASMSREKETVIADPVTATPDAPSDGVLLSRSGATSVVKLQEKGHQPSPVNGRQSLIDWDTDDLRASSHCPKAVPL